MAGELLLERLSIICLDSVAYWPMLFGGDLERSPELGCPKLEAVGVDARPSQTGLEHRQPRGAKERQMRLGVVADETIDVGADGSQLLSLIVLRRDYRYRLSRPASPTSLTTTIDRGQPGLPPPWRRLRSGELGHDVAVPVEEATEGRGQAGDVGIAHRQGERDVAAPGDVAAGLDQ